MNHFRHNAFLSFMSSSYFGSSFHRVKLLVYHGSINALNGRRKVEITKIEFCFQAPHYTSVSIMKLEPSLSIAFNGKVGE